MTSTDAAPFESLSELRSEHGRLLRAAARTSPRTDAPGPPLAEDVIRFLTRARATGAKLDSPADREAAQGVLDYWTATLFTLPNGVSAASNLPSLMPGESDAAVNVQLAEFDSATLESACAAADRWLAAQAEPDRELARHVLMRLVRLQSDGTKFDPVPSVRGALHDLDTPERVSATIDGLVNAAVVRVTRSETPDMDRVALRSPQLLSHWGTLRAWLDHRLALRETVSEWQNNGRLPSYLLTGDALEEARNYYDRNAIEFEFTEKSRSREQRRSSRNRIMVWVLGAALLVIVGAAVLISLLYFQHKTMLKQTQELLQARAEIDQQRSSDLQLREEKQRLLNSIYLIRTLAEIGTLPEDERRVAVWHWNGLVENFQLEPGFSAYARNIGLSLENRDDKPPPDRDADREHALKAARTLKAYLDANAPLDPAIQFLMSEMQEVAYKMVEEVTQYTVRTYETTMFADAKPYVKEFNNLYWGEMGVFEGPDVIRAMISFKQELDQIEADVNRSVFGPRDPTSNANEDTWQALQTVKNKTGRRDEYHALLRELASRTVDLQRLEELKTRQRTLVNALQRELAADKQSKPRVSPKY